MDTLNPEHPPVIVAPAQRPPRIWKFWGTALWGLFIFGGMFVGQAAVIGYFVLRQGGPIDVASAIPAQDVAAGAELPILPPRVALAGLREIEVDERSAARIRSGQQASAACLSPTPAPAEVAKVISTGGALVALIAEEHGRWRIRRVFVEESTAKTRN
jgi:hypothetical protein